MLSILLTSISNVKRKTMQNYERFFALVKSFNLKHTHTQSDKQTNNTNKIEMKFNE